MIDPTRPITEIHHSQREAVTINPYPSVERPHNPNGWRREYLEGCVSPADPRFAENLLAWTEAEAIAAEKIRTQAVVFWCSEGQALPHAAQTNCVTGLRCHNSGSYVANPYLRPAEFGLDLLSKVVGCYTKRKIPVWFTVRDSTLIDTPLGPVHERLGDPTLRLMHLFNLVIACGGNGAYVDSNVAYDHLAKPWVVPPPGGYAAYQPAPIDATVIVNALAPFRARGFKLFTEYGIGNAAYEANQIPVLCDTRNMPPDYKLPAPRLAIPTPAPRVIKPMHWDEAHRAKYVQLVKSRLAVMLVAGHGPIDKPEWGNADEVQAVYQAAGVVS